jgi:hypothetical protein
VTAGGRHTCATDSNAKISCFGDNSLGQTSVPAFADGAYPMTMSAGRNHTCAIMAINNPPPAGGFMTSVTCWGDNSFGQSTPPTDVAANYAMALAAGGDHTCVSNELGFLSCWGANDVGQSGEPVGALPQLSLATGHSCGIEFGGASPDGILCWGTGWGTSTPAPPTGKFEHIFAGDYINCAQTADMTQPLLCWGQAYEPWY